MSKTEIAETMDAKRFVEHFAQELRDSGVLESMGASAEALERALQQVRSKCPGFRTRSDWRITTLNYVEAELYMASRKAVTVLPDGSGCFTKSYPLPAHHWLFATTRNEPPTPPPLTFRDGEPLTGEHRRSAARKVRDCARYAIRASTANGREMDFDPDAMVQNFEVAILGEVKPGDEDCLAAEVEPAEPQCSCTERQPGRWKWRVVGRYWYAEVGPYTLSVAVKGNKARGYEYRAYQILGRYTSADWKADLDEAILEAEELALHGIAQLIRAFGRSTRVR